VHKIRLRAPGWSNIETGLSEDELLDRLVQRLSSAINKIGHYLLSRYNDSICRYNVSEK
jgi:hypothetical protein